MKILLTGASGFLGKILLADFVSKGHHVDTVGRSAAMTFSSDLAYNVPAIQEVYDVVVHAAGKAHIVPRTKEEYQQFIDVNVKGTLNLLNALSETETKPKQFVFMSSVAVYGVEHGEGITEDYPLLGVTPYASSKIAAEKLVQEWGEKFNVPILIFRLPLIAGPNPPGNLAAMIKAISKGYYFRIGKAQNRKSIVLATDIARVILENVTKKGIYNLTDGNHPTVAEIEGMICKKLGKGKPFSIPLWLLKIAASIGDLLGKKAPINSYKLEKLRSALVFDSKKAEQELNFKPHAFIHSGF